jgi:hypothetical protein
MQNAYSCPFTLLSSLIYILNAHLHLSLENVFLLCNTFGQCEMHIHVLLHLLLKTNKDIIN